jgi:hypothetical protein
MRRRGAKTSDSDRKSPPVTYLLLMTPAADSLVARWRADHDWTARRGLSAHVTVRTPFLERPQWSDPGLTRVLAPFVPTPVTLARLENRPGGLVILAEPDDALWRITDATTAAWPDLPPHKGGRPDAAFHVTVVRTPDPDLWRAASDSIAPHLPLTVDGTAFWVADEGASHAPLVGELR